MGGHLDWRGKQVEGDVLAKVADALTEFGLRCEANAKQRLRPSEQSGGEWVKGGGHGVRTGTLRRSIHCASPGYSWESDDAEPGPGTPDRGGDRAQPELVSGQLTLQIGSGLNYAIYVHQDHTDP